MRLDDACKMFEGILEGLYTAQELLYALDPPKEWSPRDQKLLTTHEIRQQWFAANMQGKSIGVNVPEWKEYENVKRFAKVPRESKHTRPSLFDILIGRLARKGIHIHYRPTLDKVYVPFAEKINDKPEIKPAEIVVKRAEIKKENEEREYYRPVNRHGYYSTKKRVRAERKLSIAKMMAEKENATQKAIDRYQYMLLSEQQRFPGLPSCYLPKGI